MLTAAVNNYEDVELEMNKLFKRLPCEESREKLVEMNLNLVWSLVRKFNKSGVDTEDLFQIGCIGLIKAIDRYDLSKGIKFSTYAYSLISGEIRIFLRDNNLIKISRDLKILAYKALKLKEEVLLKSNIELKIFELAKMLECSEDDLSLALSSTQKIASLYESTNDSSDNSAIYIIDKLVSGDTDMIIDESAIGVRYEVSKLNDIEKKIIKLRYFNDRTQKQTAKEVSISQVHVGRLEKRAIKKMSINLK